MHLKFQLPSDFEQNHIHACHHQLPPSTTGAGSRTYWSCVESTLLMLRTPLLFCWLKKVVAHSGETLYLAQQSSLISGELITASCSGVYVQARVQC